LTGSDVAVDLLVRLCSDATITPAMVKDGQALAGRVAETAALSFMQQVRAPAPEERVVPLHASRTRPRSPPMTVARPDVAAGQLLRSILPEVYRRAGGDPPLLPTTRTPPGLDSYTAENALSPVLRLVDEQYFARCARGWTRPDRVVDGETPPSDGKQHGSMQREDVAIAAGSLQTGGRHRLAYAVYVCSSCPVRVVLSDVESSERAEGIVTACPAVCVWATNRHFGAERTHTPAVLVIPDPVLAMLRGCFGDNLANVSVEIEHIQPPLTGIARQDIVIEPPRPGAWSLIGKRVHLVRAAGAGVSEGRGAGDGLSAQAGQLRPADSRSALVNVGYNSAGRRIIVAPRTRRTALSEHALDDVQSFLDPPPEQDDHLTAHKPPAPSDPLDDGCDEAALDDGVARVLELDGDGQDEPLAKVCRETVPAALELLRHG
jgi:hypothetical protein